MAMLVQDVPFQNGSNAGVNDAIHLSSASAVDNTHRQPGPEPSVAAAVPSKQPGECTRPEREGLTAVDAAGADAVFEAFDSPELRALKNLKWASGRALTAHIQDLALSDGKRAMVATSGGSFKKFVCSSETPCMWLVNAVRTRPRARKKPRMDGDARALAGEDGEDGEDDVVMETSAETAKRKYWYVSSAYLLHTNCTGMAKPTARQLKDVSVLKEAVQQDTKISSSSLVEQLKNKARLLCSKSMVYKAKVDLLDELESDDATTPVGTSVRGVGFSAVGSMVSVASTSGGDGDIVQSTQRLPSYLARLGALNPDILHTMERDPSSNANYYRAVVALAPLRFFANGTPLMFGLDSVAGRSAQSGTSGYAQLLLLGSDANFDTITFAAAHVPELSEEHIGWFLTKLMECGYPLQRANAFYCDGRWPTSSACALVGIHSTMQDMRYLIEDLAQAVTPQLAGYERPVAQANVPFSADIIECIYAAQRAESEGEFYAALHKLEISYPPLGSEGFRQQVVSDTGVLAAQQLRGLDPRGWALFPRFSSTRLYGWQTTRFAPSSEPAGAALETIRRGLHLPCIYFKTISLVLLKEAYHRQERALQWEREQRVVTPEAERLMQEEMKFVPLFDVAMSTPHIAFVWNPQEAPQFRQRRVDLQSRTCTCAMNLQFGVPCRHILSVLRKINALGQSFDYFDECLRVRGYAEAYKGHQIELPLDETLVPDPTWLPSNRIVMTTTSEPTAVEAESSTNGGFQSVLTPPSRKRRVRNKPADERKRPLYKCRKCSIADGHNSMTCLNRRVKKFS